MQRSCVSPQVSLPNSVPNLYFFIMAPFSRFWAVVVVGLAPIFIPAGIAQTGTALINHASIINGTIEGSVHQMLPENVVINGSASVIDLVVSGSPKLRVNGRPHFGGLIVGNGVPEPLDYEVVIGGNARVGHVRTRSDVRPLPMAASPEVPRGIRSITVNASAEDIGDFATVRDLSLTGSVGQVAVPPGAYGVFTANGVSGFTLGVEGSTRHEIYSFEQLVLNGHTTIRVVSPVVVVLGRELSISGVAGSSDHPHWLQLRFASGGLVLNGGAKIFANVLAPNGSVVARGGSQLVGGLSSDRLIIDGGALVRLVNQPPTVSLAAPAAGARIVSKPVPLVATASDLDGAIAKVEFFVDGTQIAESVEAPFLAEWSPMTGSYTLGVRAYDDLGAVSDAMPVSVRVLPELPYTTDFEATEGYTLGTLGGQQAWVAEAGNVTTTDSAFYSGERSVLLAASAPPAQLAQHFARNSNEVVVFVDLFIKPVADVDMDASTIIETDVARVAFLRNGTSGTIHSFDGDGVGGGFWHPTLAVKPLDGEGRAASWTRVTLREDHLAKRWDLYSDGVLVAADLKFRDEAEVVFSEFSLRGHSLMDARFDYFYAGAENPLFVDADQDGIEDSWERSHGMNPAVNDRTADLDGDGVSSIQEYVNGTDPTDYYNGVSPVLTSLVDASGQAGEFGLIAVRVTTTQGGVLTNAPVTFNVGSTVARLASLPGESAYQQTNVRTDAEGIARVYITFFSYAPAEITVTARSSLLPIRIQPPTTDADEDGLPDLWETTYFGLMGGNANDDPDGDGLTNAQEFQRGSSPTDYYNGVLPQTESLVGADGQIAPDGSIAVKVTDASGNALSNAPVTFTAKEGGHKLAETAGGEPLNEAVVRTNASGVAKVYIRAGSN